LHKLKEKTPVGLVSFDKQFWPTTDVLDEMHRQDEWLYIQENSVLYKENWAIFWQLQASECSKYGWVARVQTRWMATWWQKMPHLHMSFSAEELYNYLLFFALLFALLRKETCNLGHLVPWNAVSTA